MPAAVPGPAVPFAQIEYNGGKDNPLWEYFVAHKEGPMLHKWCVSLSEGGSMSFVYSEPTHASWSASEALTCRAVRYASQAELL